MNKNIRLILISGIILALSAVLFWQGLGSYSSNITPTTPSPRTPQVLGQQSDLTQSTPAAQLQNAFVTRVVDGDTIEVNIDGNLKKLRYVGIDTPETVDPHRPQGCFGKEASDENKRLVGNKEVYLKKDVSETDKFGRLLRLVYLKLDDGSLLFVNDYLVREGYANVATYPPDVKYSQQFTLAAQEARDNNRGLWAKCK